MVTASETVCLGVSIGMEDTCRVDAGAAEPVKFILWEILFMNDAHLALLSLGIVREGEHLALWSPPRPSDVAAL